MLDVLITIWFSVIIISVWILYQNWRTFNDIERLIEVAYDSSDWIFLVKELRRVTYNQHLYARCLLKDWRKLYSKELIDLL